MIVCGLDVASQTGLAVLDGDRVVTATWYAKKEKQKKRGDAAEEEEAIRAKLLDRDTTIDPAWSGEIGRQFEDYLRAFLIEHGVQHCAVEAPLNSNFQGRTKTEVDTSAEWAGRALKKTRVAVTSFATLYRLYGLNFTALTVCRRLGIPCEIVNQAEWRKAFLGNGRPPDAKAAAVAQCARLKIPISSPDAAEAYGIAWWLRGHLNPYYGTRAGDLFARA